MEKNIIAKGLAERTGGIKEEKQSTNRLLGKKGKGKRNEEMPKGHKEKGKKKALERARGLTGFE